jgi:hypothetical protein
MPRSISDLIRTFEDRFRVGKAGGGAKSFELFNGFLGRLIWTPTANRDIIIPDQSGTIVLQNAGRIDGLLPAIANGQPATFEQLTTASTAQYEGAVFYQVGASSGTALSTIGAVVPATSGTLSNPTIGTTGSLAGARRTVNTGAATAGTVAFIRASVYLFWRGNAANRGGFRLIMRFGLEILVAGQRGFFGIADNAAVNPANLDPLVSVAAGRIGLAFNTNTGNWQLVSNIANGTPTVLDLGANFPINTTDLIELTLAALPNAAGIDYAVINKATGTSSSGVLTTNIPSNTTLLSPIQWMTNNATAAAFAFSNAVTKLTTPN